MRHALRHQRHSAEVQRRGQWVAEHRDGAGGRVRCPEHLHLGAVAGALGGERVEEERRLGGRVGWRRVRRPRMRRGGGGGGGLCAAVGEGEGGVPALLLVGCGRQGRLCAGKRKGPHGATPHGQRHGAVGRQLAPELSRYDGIR